MPDPTIPRNRTLLRDETPGDADAVDRLIRAAFAVAGPGDGNDEVLIMRALRRDATGILALVATQGEAVVGQAAFSPVAIQDGPTDWYGLGPVAVRPDRQRRGIGSALVGHGLQRLRAARAGGCVVLGDARFYARFGFRHDPRLTAPGLPSEHFMALAFGGPVPAGAVAYHPAFAAAG